jgi:alginate O-acetyltransferase complex protein AlgI
MSGAQPNLPSSALLSGMIYKPYYLLSVCLAAIVVWLGRQTWDWTQQITLPKAFLCCAACWLALAALATQEYNPFIYFIF